MKFTLPLFGSTTTTPPAVDEAREQLGGRISTASGAGELVSIANARGDLVLGVVIFDSSTECDVWIGEQRVRRIPSEAKNPPNGTPNAELIEIAEDARRFAKLKEGDAVRYSAIGAPQNLGQIVEKCRYGALVQTMDERIIAVGFRRIWLAAVGST